MGDLTTEGLVTDQLAAYMVRVLGAVAAADAHDQLWWRCDATFGPVSFFVDCSDVFSWAGCDMEPITPDNVAELERAYADAREASDGDTTFGGTLFACRMRGQRPQGAAYPSDRRLWPLFDACGPQREVDMFNPKPQPSAGPDFRPDGLLVAPNEWGCHDRQCHDSTWDHACPVTPPADGVPEVA
jgi:hypothetical protein